MTDTEWAEMRGLLREAGVIGPCDPPAQIETHRAEIEARIEAAQQQQRRVSAQAALSSMMERLIGPAGVPASRPRLSPDDELAVWIGRLVLDIAALIRDNA